MKILRNIWNSFRFGGHDSIINPNPNIICFAKITNLNPNIWDSEEKIQIRILIWVFVCRISIGHLSLNIIFDRQWSPILFMFMTLPKSWHITLSVKAVIIVPSSVSSIHSWPLTTAGSALATRPSLIDEMWISRRVPISQIIATLGVPVPPAFKGTPVSEAFIIWIRIHYSNHYKKDGNISVHSSNCMSRIGIQVVARRQWEF